MKRATFRHLEEIIRSYPNLDQTIKMLANTPQITPGVAVMIYELSREQTIVRDTLSTVDETTRQIITELYFKRYQTKNITGIADKLFISKRTLFRKRNYFLEQVRYKLGWI